MHQPIASTRQPEDPAPDLVDYRVVHRAMVVDMKRLTRAGRPTDRATGCAADGRAATLSARHRSRN